MAPVAEVHGWPALVPPRQISVLKAPLCPDVCPGQSRVPLPVFVCDPVLSGFRLIGMSPTNCAQKPPPVQSAFVMQAGLLFEPL